MMIGKPLKFERVSQTVRKRNSPDKLKDIEQKQNKYDNRLTGLVANQAEYYALIGKTATASETPTKESSSSERTERAPAKNITTLCLSARHNGRANAQGGHVAAAARVHAQQQGPHSPQHTEQ
jgi:peptidoglycan hydrolase CwlO-like protein